MDNHQKIQCEVHSCLYNGKDNCECLLSQITVKPCKNCNTGDTDESKCGSYISKF